MSLARAEPAISLTPANFALCDTRLSELREMMEEYKKEPHGRAIIYMDESMEYGEDFKPLSYFLAAFQLRIMPTAAGRLQIAICECSRGMLGSGWYSDSSEDAMAYALKSLHRFHRTTPFSNRLKSTGPAYAFRFISIVE